MDDAEADEYDAEYNRKAVRSTAVIALEEALKDFDPERPLIRLDDIPVHRLRRYVRAVPSKDYVERVRAALAASTEAADRAAAEYRRTAPRGPDGSIRDVCGFASLVAHAPRSQFTEALLRLGAATPITRVGYVIDAFTKCCVDQALGEQEAAVRAAQEVMEKEFPDVLFSVRSLWD